MPNLFRQAILRWGTQQTPRDYTEDTDWETTEFGLMASGGEANHGTWSVRVVDGDVPDHRNGGQKYLGAHNVLKVTVGSNTIYRGRIAAQDVERGDSVTFRNQRWQITLEDYNADLHGIGVHNFSRPSETDAARVQGIVAQYLSGSPRPSTNLNGSNYVITGSNAITMPAKVYTAMDVSEVLTEIAQFADKEMFVDVDGNLHYHGHDYTGFDSILRISDDVADLNSVTCLTIDPSMTEEGRNHVTALRTYYGPGDDSGNQFSVFNQFAAPRSDYWEEINFDDASVNATQAAQNAANLLQVMHQDPITYSVTVGMPGTIQQGNGTPMTGDYVWMLKAGQRIGFKSKAARGGYASTGAAFADSFFTTHIRAVRWTMPTPDAYYAHLELEKPLRISPRGRGNPIGAEPMPECPPEEPAPGDTLISDTDSAGWLGTISTGDGFTGNYRFIGGSGGTSAPTETVSGVTPGDYSLTLILGGSEHRYTGHIWVEDSSSVLPQQAITFPDHVRAPGGHGDVTSYSQPFEVPTGYDRIRYRHDGKMGGWRYQAFIYALAAPPDDTGDDDCIPPGSGGTNPRFARFDDPRFDQADQHDTTRIVQPDAVNNSGGDLDVGDVVIPDITFDGFGVTTTTDAAQTDAMVGVVRTGGADGDTIRVQWFGVMGTVNIDGTAVDGDYLYTSTTAGACDVSGTRDVGAVGRVIRDVGGEASYVLWWGTPDSGSGGGTGDHGALTGLADDDHTQYVRTTLGGRDVVSTVAAAGSTETLSLATANFHDVTLSADCTLTLTGATNGVACYMAILLRQGSGAPWEVTWPASVEWVGGSAPVLQTGEDEWNLITLVTRDGGTVWFGDASAGTGGGSIDYGEDADISDLDFSDTADAGVLDEVARADHVHGMPADPGAGGSGNVGTGGSSIIIPDLLSHPGKAGLGGGGITEEYSTSTTGLTWSTAPTTVDSDTTIPNALFVDISLNSTESLGLRAWAPGASAAFDCRTHLALASDNSTTATGGGLIVTSSGDTSRVLVQYTLSRSAVLVQAFTYAAGSYTQRGSSNTVNYPPDMYLKITRDGSNNVSFWWSLTGYLWNLAATQSFTFTPASIGYRLSAGAGPLPVRAQSNFLRTTT